MLFTTPHASPVRKAVYMLIILIAAGIFCFLSMLLILTVAEKRVPTPQGEYDAIIILGAQVKEDGTPSNQLRLRLEKALEQYQRSPALMVVCGAQGANEPAPEGEVMRAWLIQRGVPASMVISECESFNTWQNIRNAQKLLPEDATRVVIVTSDYLDQNASMQAAAVSSTISLIIAQQTAMCAAIAAANAANNANN